MFVSDSEMTPAKLTSDGVTGAGVGRFGGEESEQATEDANTSVANQRIGCTVAVVCLLDPAQGGPTSLSGFFRFS
jgi:hypothetical protein